MKKETIIMLEKLGLSEKASHIYLTLIEKGVLKASTISRISKVPRTLVYKILEDLENFGLVMKHEDNKIISYSAEHPEKLSTLVEKSEKSAKEAQQAFSYSIPFLTEAYIGNYSTPGIRILSGISGFKRLQQDIQKEKKALYIIWSLKAQVSTKNMPEIAEIVEQARKKQDSLGIKVKSIKPVMGTFLPKKVLEESKKKSTESRWIREGDLFTPAQVMLYGDKVAFISIRDDIVITVIQDKLVSETMNQMFRYIWNTSQKVHDDIVKNAK
jgi:sugar-specific transcriptional regulator TrmB